MLLLDTHVLLWWLHDDARLGPKVKSIVADPSSTVYVSAASAWEIAVKYQIGRLSLASAPEDWFGDELTKNQFHILSIGLEEALAAGALPLHHRDPFDRMLIAQAQLNGYTLVTSDAAMKQYEIQLLAADV